MWQSPFAGIGVFLTSTIDMKRPASWNLGQRYPGRIESVLSFASLSLGACAFYHLSRTHPRPPLRKSQ